MSPHTILGRPHPAVAKGCTIFCRRKRVSSNLYHQVRSASSAEVWSSGIFLKLNLCCTLQVTHNYDISVIELVSMFVINEITYLTKICFLFKRDFPRSVTTFKCDVADSNKEVPTDFRDESTISGNHDDVIKREHFLRYWPFVRGIHRSTVNSPHKGQWRRALMFSLISVWINGWVNNREARDLRRLRAHYDVIVMSFIINCIRLICTPGPRLNIKTVFSVMGFSL